MSYNEEFTKDCDLGLNHCTNGNCEHQDVTDGVCVHYNPVDDLKPEYDFDYSKGVIGKYAPNFELYQIIQELLDSLEEYIRTDNVANGEGSGCYCYPNEMFVEIRNKAKEILKNRTLKNK